MESQLKVPPPKGLGRRRVEVPNAQGRGGPRVIEPRVDRIAKSMPQTFSGPELTWVTDRVPFVSPGFTVHLFRHSSTPGLGPNR